MLADVKSNQVHALAAGCYTFGAGGVFLRMVLAGGALAPIAWYILGTGVYFGLGAALWGLVPDLYSYGRLHAGPGDLARVNLLNSSSITLVLAVAFFFQRKKMILPTSVSQPQLKWIVIYNLTIPLVAFSLVLSLIFFPIAENLLIRGFQSKLGLVIPMYLVMTGMFWANIGFSKKLLSLVVIAVVLLIGVLSFSKTAVIYPILCLVGGYWAIHRTWRSVLLPLVSVFIIFIFVLVPNIGGGRAAGNYDSTNSMSMRLEILESQSSSRVEALAINSAVKSLSRVSHGPFQRFLIDEYLAGRSGESLSDFWVALVPRVFWPEKPNVTRFGAELYNFFFGTRGVSSQLAPTYSAEAYWNYGGVGVLVISILIGLQLGWLTRCWFYAVQGRGQGYLIIAFPAAYLGLNVEAWAAASYFGGFVTLVILWRLVELALSVLVKRPRPKGSLPVASGHDRIFSP
jgi:hypothetical protein